MARKTWKIQWKHVGVPTLEALKSVIGLANLAVFLFIQAKHNWPEPDVLHLGPEILAYIAFLGAAPEACSLGRSKPFPKETKIK